MPIDLAGKRAAFRRLHESGCFVLPNPWDVGGIRRLEKLGFEALASSSAACAWALGKADGELTKEEALAHLRALAHATDLPVNADFESGFGDRPDDVAASVLLAVDTGVAGISIEDRIGSTLYALPEATERLRAARHAIDRSGTGVMLLGRTEGLLLGSTDVGAAIERLVAYRDAGADCLYAPCVSEPDAIRAIVAAVAPTPVNVLLMDGMHVHELAKLGVRRVSTGSALAKAAWSAFDRAAQELARSGTLVPNVSD